MIRQSFDAPAQATPNGRRLSQSEAFDRYRALLDRLPWPASGPNGVLRTLGITSCQSGEGVSTVAAHLAIAAANVGERRILLVDANFARPALANLFGVAPSPGLADAFQNGSELSDVVQRCDIARLSLLTSGEASGGRALLDDATGLPDALKELVGDFDLAVFDLPPVGQSSEALRFAGLLDGILLVVEAERARRDLAQQATDSLLRAGARPLGAVLNKWQRHIPAWLSRRL